MRRMSKQDKCRMNSKRPSRSRMKEVYRHRTSKMKEPSKDNTQ